MDVTLSLDDENYSVLTIALTEYVDELEFRAHDGGPNATHFRQSADRARDILETIEKAVDDGSR